MATHNNFDLNFQPDEDHFDLNELPNSYQREKDEGRHEEDNSVFELDRESTRDIPSMIDQNIESNEEEDHLPAHPEEGNQQGKYRSSSNEERKLIYAALQERSDNGKLKRDTTKHVSSLFSMPLRTVQRIWKRGKDTPNGTSVDPSHRRAKKCGWKRGEFDLDRIADIPLNRRTTLRSLGGALNVNHVTPHSRLKEGLIRRHSNAIKPHLKEENKIHRLRFCLSMLDADSLPHEPKFVGMYNTVHIDEKWFYMTKKSNTYYLLPNEEEPLRSCQSKNFIGKVMFLAAVARPRFDDDGNELFSGKIGVFPFVTMQPAKRRSRNREAGTLETKPITSVTKEIIRTYLLEKVIPAIQANWPREDIGNTIYIQQDNARTHVQPTDLDFQRAASQNGFDIRLTCQPANSPDMNVLDLGFFNAIQSLQHKECTRTVDELIGDVQRAFIEYPTEKINHVFLSLQLGMRETMRVEGSNDYQTPHINKNSLHRGDCLPTQITCDYDLVEKSMNIVGRGGEVGE